MTTDLIKKWNEITCLSLYFQRRSVCQNFMNFMSDIWKVWGHFSLKIKATLVFLGLILPIFIFFDIDYSTFRDRVRSQLLVEEAPDNQLTILISRFQFDTDGRYTSEIEAGLLDKGWESIRFRQTLTANELIESSRARKVSELETVAELFKRHGGDVLITGEVAADNGVLRVKIFDKSGNAPVTVLLNVQEEWIEVLSLHVEKIVLDTLIQTGARRHGDNSNEFLRRVMPIESKIQQLIEMTQTSPLREDARDKHRHLSIEIGQILGDISRLTSAREELETKLSKKGTFQTMQERIIAKGNVVDLLRVEALILGDAQLLNKSFRLSKEIRILRGVSPDEQLVYKDGLKKNPSYRSILETDSVAALACRDKQRIDELLKIYEHTAACRTDIMDTRCPLWSSRAIFSLRYGRFAWSVSEPARLQAAAYVVDKWARIVGYGGRVRHWADPMTHADRLLRARLGIDYNAEVSFPGDRISLPDTFIPDENVCPDLIRLAVLPSSP